MELIQNIYNVLINSDKLYKIIQLIPFDEEEQCQLHIHEEADTLDIGITKKIYLQIFKDSHTFFNQIPNQSITSLSQNELHQLYLMTLGFLITTNEHSTIISLHEQLIKKLGCYQQDLEIISSFLNCKVKRINKSSSLWYLLKKLTLSQVYEKKDHILLKKLSLRALKSCQIHFANYYANNYLRWIITMNQLLGISNDFLMKELRKLCHLILSDSSLWSTFCFLIGGSNEKHFEFVIFELSQVTNSNFQFDNTNKVDYQNIIIDEFKWLINVQCHYLSPFKLLIQSCESIEILQLIKLKSQDIKFDEKLRIEIIKLIDFQISILQTKSTT